MSKEWVIKREELKPEPLFKKAHNAEKFIELDNHMREVCGLAYEADSDLVEKVCRKIIEEVTNIIQHNKTWNEVRCQTKLNAETGNYRFRIKYDGGTYYDPKHLANVVGPSIGKFKEYERKHDEAEDGTITIRIFVKLQRA